MNLLVTGGAGFIGCNVIRHIIDQPAIRLLVNLDCLTYAGHLESLGDVQQNPRYRFARVDLRDQAAVVRTIEEHAITHVLHLAAESHVDRSILGPGDFIQTNIIGTYHLLEACRAAWGGSFSGRRFHHVSTDEVYGSLGATGCFTESSAYAPNSPYAASKAASDHLVRAYHNTYGLPAVITHCSNNYGPYQYPEKLIPVAIQSLMAGRPIRVYGDGHHVRDWLFVRDHAEALWRVLQHGRDGETYDIGGGAEWTNLELARRLCEIFDELAADHGGWQGERIEFVQDRPGHDERYAIDASKIRNELGWAPACSFEHSLRETVQWYRQHQEWVRRVTETKG